VDSYTSIASLLTLGSDVTPTLGVSGFQRAAYVAFSLARDSLPEMAPLVPACPWRHSGNRRVASGAPWRITARERALRRTGACARANGAPQ
jgi:hypothetical protein